MGIAEADPSGDIDGFDASVKVAALMRALSGSEVGLEHVETQVGEGAWEGAWEGGEDRSVGGR